MGSGFERFWKPRKPVELKSLKDLKQGRSVNRKPGPKRAPRKTILLTLTKKSPKYFLQLEYSYVLLGDRFEYYSTKVVMIQSCLLEDVLSQSPFFAVVVVVAVAFVVAVEVEVDVEVGVDALDVVDDLKTKFNTLRVLI